VRTPEIAFACSGCKAEVGAAPGAGATCAACGTVTTLEVPPAVRDGGPIETCPACGSRLLYVQRDFNQKAGLAVVVVGAALAPFTPFYSSLMVAALIDAALYALLPEITVCYRCHAHFRGFARNPAHQAFDLHLAEQYETHDRA
jgi:DNA-directed RNA polymerase subunit RPC12/RpoP